ncbi:MAG: global cell cycle regulator GcrA-like protein [Alphaproteobacteria bacterium]|nr:global cell cycle regulator GcrA-like protein [Alphaproteobacteria bacterium]
MIWTPEKVQELKKLWESGLSTGEIGRILGVSKNAIVGKVHRLALESRPSPILPAPKVEKVKKKVKRKRTPKKEKTENEGVAVETSSEKKKTSSPKKRKGVALTDLTPTSCRWPEGDPKDPDFSFCGKEVVPGKIYCAEHCAVAYSTLLKTK